MSVRARYFAVIIGLVTIVVGVLAYFQCARLINAHLTAKVAAENMVATNVLALVQKAVNEHPELSAESAIKDDLQVRAWLEAVGSKAYFSYFGIRGADSNVLIEYDPLHYRNNSVVIPFETLQNKSWIRQWLDLRHPHYLYEISTPLNVNSQPFGRFVAAVSAQTLYNEVLPDLRLALSIAMVAGLLAILLAVLLSNLVLRPLREFFGLIDQLEVESAAQNADEKEPSGQDLQWAAQRLRELGKRFAGNRNEIEAMRDQMRQVMSNLPERLLLLDREQRVMMASPEAERLLLSWEPRLVNGNGYPQSLRGLILSDVLEETHPLSLLTRRAFNSGQLREETMTLPTPEDKEHKLLVSVQVFEEHGQLAGALLTLRDFESLKRLETQLDYAARLAALSRITSGVAHEVKNPLHAMVLHLELLRAKLDGGRDPSTHVEVLTSEVNRLNRVVQTFLDFTRPVQMQNRRYDLNEIVREVALLAPERPEAGIQLVTNCSSSPLFIDADVDLLKQALLNIVINAYQAMPDGGIVMVTTSKTGKAAEIVITDQGTGIPPELQEKIFNLYFTTKENGSGIGLAQAFRAVQLSNRNIEVHSEVGKGTSFKITLQLK